MTTPPSPPWTLRGDGLLVLRWLPLREAQRHLPPGVRLIPLLPGRTLSAVLCAHYADGSTLQYNELIFAPGLARARGRLGWWISRIWVDDPLALDGGRQIWGLPKQLARFEWEPERRAVKVFAPDDPQPLLTLSCHGMPARRGGFPVPLRASVLATGTRTGLRFPVRGKVRTRATRGWLRAAPGDGMPTSANVRIFALDDLQLTVQDLVR